VIGIVQVGSQARADRYTYLPQIGLYVLLTWAVADLCAGWRHRRVALGGGAAIILVALIVCACVQTTYWRNSELLWTHTLVCTSDNDIAHCNLGGAYLQNGKVDEAMVHFQKALQINPNSPDVHNSLGNVLLQEGSVDEAMVHYQRALEIKPNSAEACYNFGNALLLKRNVDEAITYYQKALQIKPDSTEAQNNLAWVLATAPQASLRNGRQAVELAQQANLVACGEDSTILRTLAAAYAEAGRYSDAQQSAQKAMSLAQATGQTDLVELLNGELKLYAAGLPFHQESK
jgi:tetratricopeptide (TPR) repeat protein